MKRKSEDDRCAKGGLSSRMGIARWNVEASRKLVNRNSPTPLFFVSAAAKGFSLAVSLLFATLAGGFISVAAKGLTGTKYWRESKGPGWEDFGRARRTTWRAGIERGHERNVPIHLHKLWHRRTVCQIITYKCFICIELVWKGSTKSKEVVPGVGVEPT